MLNACYQSQRQSGEEMKYVPNSGVVVIQVIEPTSFDLRYPTIGDSTCQHSIDWGKNSKISKRSDPLPGMIRQPHERTTAAWNPARGARILLMDAQYVIAHLNEQLELLTSGEYATFGNGRGMEARKTSFIPLPLYYLMWSRFN